MGMRLSVYVGAYLKLEKEKTEEFIFSFKCSNRSCINGIKETKEVSNFCSLCGSEIKEIKKTIEKEEYLNWVKFSRENDLEVDELCFVSESGILFSNYNKGVKLINENSVSELQISELDIKRMKAEFMDRHIDTISEVNRILGKKLEVKFGVFSVWW